jgi:hypothetical protein
VATTVVAADRPILVTGAHRSGTTWVGRMLALVPGVEYIHEPFNPVGPAGICNARFDHYYTSSRRGTRASISVRFSAHFDFAKGGSHRFARSTRCVREGEPFGRV